jgi:hypothetical protein
VNRVSSRRASSGVRRREPRLRVAVHRVRRRPIRRTRSRASSSAVGFLGGDRPMENLSRGCSRRSRSQALTSPVLLLLDEPTRLDPRSKLEVQEFIRRCGRRTTRRSSARTTLPSGGRRPDRRARPRELLALEPVDELMALRASPRGGVLRRDRPRSRTRAAADDERRCSPDASHESGTT